MFVQENFGRQEQHLEQHYNDVLHTLSQRYDEGSTGLQEEKKSKLESLYSQLLVCGQALDASKELIEMAQEIYRCQDKRFFLKLPNSATQTSLHVCWSLFSDDTVEYYELYYRPVLEDMPADSTCAPQGMIFFRMAAGLPCNDYTIFCKYGGLVFF
ncbi:hypothetical protein XENOCAPTIV_027004 [Xenoophorus captivus]|uniref:Fibronectin type-III domain-containing protein n=1 Tax=Xenoophorus captivus TaxID=1517983 RepID=A0ABV0S8R5_9TELE